MGGTTIAIRGRKESQMELEHPPADLYMNILGFSWTYVHTLFGQTEGIPFRSYPVYVKKAHDHSFIRSFPSLNGGSSGWGGGSSCFVKCFKQL